MRNRIIIIMLLQAYLCGCQSRDPYVRRSELREESRQIALAQISLAVTALDRNVNATVKKLTSSIEQDEKSIDALQSKLDTFAAENAKALWQLKSDTDKAISRNSDSIKHNTESISLLKSTVNEFIKQSTQSVADVNSGLIQVEEKIAQLGLDVQRQFWQQEADRTETNNQLVEKTDQLAEKINQLDNRLQRILIQQEDVLRPATDQAALDSRCLTLEPHRAAKIKHPVSSIQLPDQWYFAAIGPLVIVIGPLIAELYARRQKNLARSLDRRVVQIPTR